MHSRGEREREALRSERERERARCSVPRLIDGQLYLETSRRKSAETSRSTDPDCDVELFGNAADAARARAPGSSLFVSSFPPPPLPLLSTTMRARGE